MAPHKLKTPIEHARGSAGSLYDIVMMTAKAKIDASPERVEEFKMLYKKHSRNQRDLDSSRLVQEVCERLFHFFDALFFLNQLKKKVSLTVIRGRNKKEGKYGCYHPSSHMIEIWTEVQEGETVIWDLFVVTVAHEMCHAWLEEFSNADSDEYSRCVEPDGGHGRTFWRVLEPMLFMVNEWVGSKIIQFEYERAHRKAWS
ncbi:hypothetical protein F4778DRAFT_758853 [Xylariomycetidae sp. FL2044]|nr:hypothetical protein F4778DRAFT_758853 [Xylariomycetidae sp. FL2044]